MSSDPLLKAAIAHWGPRFVANGVVLTDFEEVTARSPSYDEWCSAWSRARRTTSSSGARRLAKKHFLTAGECSAARRRLLPFLLRSCSCMTRPQMKAAHKKQIECRQAALPHLRPSGERVEIPYQGKTLAGILRKPAGVDKPPVVVMAVGLDSTKEEGDAYEAPFLARGVATLMFEGPGQGEAQYDFPIRGDYEVPVKAVIDFVEMRPDLDAKRIGMWGVSLGGYYAPRAAAFDKRIKACIALGGPFNWGENWDNLPGIDARGIPRAQPLQDGGRSAQERNDAIAGRRRAKYHLPTVHRERPARPYRPGQGRRASRA